MKLRHFVLSACVLTTAQQAVAQSNSLDSLKMAKIAATPVRRLYWGNSMDMAIFSTALMQRTGESQKMSTLRFSYVLNFGFNLNYDFSKHAGLFTGIGIKNIGFIEKVQDSTIKRRVYTIGIPLGIKFGNLQSRNFGFIGGGIDMPFNYREKGFVKRNKKEKMSEWFSDRNETFMPYVFAGLSVKPGITAKIQYYPGDFLNTDFKETKNGVTYKPYAYFEKLNLLTLSIGIDIHYKKQPKESDSSASGDADTAMK
jgi:hypothetical protein